MDDNSHYPETSGSDGSHVVPPHVPLSQPEHHVGQVARRSKNRESTLPFLMRTLVVLVTILTIRYVVPAFIEEVQYALTRGRQRAEFETAGELLQTAGLDSLSTAYEMVSSRTAPSVVHIDTLRTSRETVVQDERQYLLGAPRRYFRRWSERGQGSGVVVDPSGFVLTNYHVIDGATQIKVALSDGRSFPAQMIGHDVLTDLAVLKIPAENLIAVTWGDSDELQEGALVWAVGSPFGLRSTITAGIVSAKNRAGMAGQAYQDFLQTDAAVNPGNSGGPLVDAKGRVVGINTMIVGESYQGISFAIPSSIAQNVYETLRQQGHVERGWLGVALDDVTEELARELGLPEETVGAIVVQLVDTPDNPSPARIAGLRPGDVVTQWNGTPIHSRTELSRAVAQTEIGVEVDVIVVRDRQKVKHRVRVALRPSER